MAALYFAAGLNHIIHPEFYKAILPSWLPFPDEIIIISGVAEMLLGIFLIPLVTRKKAAWGIIILLVVVFPANVQMLINYIELQHPNIWIAIVRLPLQLLLIWWAYIFTKEDKRLHS